jgi:hypothetical protein
MVVIVTAASIPEREGAKLIFKAFTGSCTHIEWGGMLIFAI